MLVDSSSLGLHDTIEPFLKFYYLYTDLLSFIFCLSKIILYSKKIFENDLIIKILNVNARLGKFGI